MDNLLKSLQVHFPKAEMKTGNYKDERGRSGRPVPFYRLDPSGNWMTEIQARQMLLRHVVQEKRSSQ